MTTSIEIYDERELDTITLRPEAEPEALALIEELGLKQQLSDSGKRQAYPSPTADQAFVLLTVFPTATKLEDYDAGVIPLRVLKEIRSYKAEHPNHQLFVRHSPPSEIRDPVLLAYSGEHHWMWNQASSGKDYRMIARWGDGLESWENLGKKARIMMGIKAKDALHKIIGEARAALLSIEESNEWTTASVPQLLGIP